MITATVMPNVALQNFFEGLKRSWESANGRRLEESDLRSMSGDDDAVLAILEGRSPTPDARSTILRAVERLGGDDDDAASALILAMISAERIDAEETVILNDRLLTRLQNLERFIRRVGKLDEFHDWVARGASD